jgi:threonine aldolase
MDGKYTNMIDLRSDTVTKPTKGMMSAMMAAEIGDDVFFEDPSINALQEELAGIFGHEAGLFCPSGTMANQIAINVHTRPGDEVICDRLSHIYNYEGGGIARNSGASVRLIQGDNGRFTAKDVLGEINPPASYYARTSLVCVEDTCNKGGGTYYDFQALKEIGETCKDEGLAFHLDGARAFNALVETGVSTLAYGQLFDSISICLSKGLGAPSGSVLLGNKEYIKEAHRTRKAMGGGMRQAGILAEAGRYALKHHVERLKIDHANARKLAEVLEGCDYTAKITPAQTNIVIFQLKAGLSAERFMEVAHQSGILCLPFGPDKVRFVTHLDISDAQIDKVCELLPRLKVD